MSLRISLIGAGDIEFHYFNMLKLKKEEFYREIEEIAKILAEEKCEIVLLPDKGVSFEVAKIYKKYGGKKALGAVPFSDKDFGIEHLKQYMNTKINNIKVFDDFIDTQTWYKQDLIHTTLGDIVLMLGNSLGAMGELVYGFYLYKIFSGNKQGVQAIKEKIHPEIRAGSEIPFTVIIFKRFFKEEINYEIEKYIMKIGGKIIYVDNVKELKEEINKINKFIK